MKRFFHIFNVNSTFENLNLNDFCLCNLFCSFKTVEFLYSYFIIQLSLGWLMKRFIKGKEIRNPKLTTLNTKP